MSKRFFSYLLLLLVTYALYSFTAYQEMLFLLILLTALPIVSFLLLFISRYFVHVKLSSKKNKIYRTEDLDVLLEVENRSPFYFPQVKLEFDVPRNNDLIRLKSKNNKIDTVNAETDNSVDIEKVQANSVANANKKAFVIKPTNSNSSYQLNYKQLKKSDQTFRLYKKPHYTANENLVSFALPRKSIISQNLSIEAQSKGVYEFGTDSILLQDLFSFFYLPLPKSGYSQTRDNNSDSNDNNDNTRSKNGAVLRIEVYPNPEIWQSPDAGELLAPEQVLISTANAKVSNEIDTLANVRPYQRGDRMKQIHWKLSARTGDWLAREFEDPRQGGILFLLDPKLPDSCHDPLLYTNQASEILAANMDLLSRHEGPLNLLLEEELFFAAGDGAKPLNFYRQLMYWQPQLKKNDPRASKDSFKQNCNIVANRLELSEMIRKQCQNKIYRAVVICSARMNQQLIREMSKVQKSGAQIILIFLHNETPENLNAIIKPLAGEKIRVFPIKLASLTAYVDKQANDRDNKEISANK